MQKTVRKLGQIAAVAGLGVGLGLGSQAEAALILDTTVATAFGTPSTGTHGNDMPGIQAPLYFGQLKANQNGTVDFFYVGNEAAFTNTLWVGPSISISSAGRPDDFVHGATVGSIGVGAGNFVDFGFCTDGGDAVGSGPNARCAHNDDAASLINQFNNGPMRGYRSIGFRALTGYTQNSTLAFDTASALIDSAYWGIFWDDSGADNDDNHDDLIAVARFRTAVPEPATAALFAVGLLGLGALRRRRSAN